MTADSNQANEDLETLIGESQVTIAGEQVTVRKYRFLEAARLEKECRPLINALAEALNGADVDDESAGVDYGVVMDVFANHERSMLRLMSVATGKTEQWIADLADEDGFDLMMAYWGINHPFFIRRVVMTILPAKIQKSVSPASSPP